MRRIVIVDALSRGALHFYCGKSSVLVDAYAQEEMGFCSLSEGIMAAVRERTGKFRNIDGALYTDRNTSLWCSEVLQLCTVGAEDELEDDCVSFGYISAQRYMSEDRKSCVWLLMIEGLSVLVCGNATQENIISAVDELSARVTHAFVPLSVVLNGKVASVLREKGVIHLFVNHMPNDLSAEETARLNKRVNKLTKLGVVVRIINSYPSGIIL